MSEHPFYTALNRWQYLQHQIAVLQAEEKELRKNLFSGCFPEPRDGVNKLELPDGRVLKGTPVFNRKIDKDRLKAQPKDWLPPAVLKSVFVVKTDLAVGPYKKLDEDTRKVVDGVLIVTPGLPKFEVVYPDQPLVEAPA